jgi:ATP-dependent Clp protease ATP-binding subunit ClpA
MFNRFTKDARAVVVRAQEEARALAADAIGIEHLLLGLAARPEGAAARVLDRLGLTHAALRAELVRSGEGHDAAALAAIGIDLDEVRRRVEASFGAGALARRGRSSLPFTPAAKQALELALREALALGDRSIGSEHVLLGVLRAPGPPVTEALERLGSTPAAVRAAVLEARQRAA